MSFITKTLRELNNCTASDSAESPRQCNKVIPFYPLRYALAPAEKAGYAYTHKNLERGFPVLASSQYVLRSLRDDDGFLYILDPDNREQILCFVYRSPDGETNGGKRRPASFQRLQLDEAFRATGLVGELLPFPYIPAYHHDPKIVTIWFADTLLSARKLAAIHDGSTAALGTFGTSVYLTPWLTAFAQDLNPEQAPEVPHTLRLEDIADQNPIGLDGATVLWSEYADGVIPPSVAAMRMAQGPGSARLAVVLHDPVGMASELNHRIDGVLQQWSTYNEHAARLRWVSDAIEALGNNVAREAELQTLSNDAVGSALPPGVTGGAANAARARAYEKGLAAKRKLFMESVDEKARAEFLKNDAPTVGRYQEWLNAAAADLLACGASHSGPGDLTTAIRNLYDWKDAGNFVAGRAAVVRTLFGLTCCGAGTQQLALQLTSDGPIEGSLLGLALTGHPQITAWAAARKILETTTDQIADHALKDLNALVGEIRPDAASRQLTSLVMLALIKTRAPVTAEGLWASRYVAMFEIAEGHLVVPEKIAARDVPQLLRREANLTGQIDFRMSAVPSGGNEHITVMRLNVLSKVANPAPVRELAPGLAARLSLWHQTRLGLGGLNLLASVPNTVSALSQFTVLDQSALVNSLNVTGNLLGIAGAGKGLSAAVLNRQRDLAALSGKAAEAESMKRLAHRADRMAIKFVAIASLVTALKDAIALARQGHHQSKVTAAGITIQVAAAVFGFSHLHAKLWREGLSRTGQKAGLYIVGRAALPGIVGRTAIWFAGAPAALTVTALQVAYAWNQARADRARIADWMRHGCLGIDPELDGATEQNGYYKLFLQPRIDASYQWGNIVLESVVPRFGRPRAQREVAILLPGWQPQISAYTLVQHVVFGLMTENVVDDPSNVQVRNGNGYLLLDAHNLLGNTAVRYWPNGFTQPDLILEMTH
ncbi:hypothetical protein LMG26686_05369 [Achromobacter mucicolens]|uniref:toxin VasX n=1 Tax=Achromobacter mucicolens TaxID=1389922 RepID=UPI001468464D|nr:toxin VasX [Achromobacter mucicolens]CAB3917773.1 hypothetical protein LMG26686_05369 [Achromobacter mucicolens]